MEVVQEGKIQVKPRNYVKTTKVPFLSERQTIFTHLLVGHFVIVH